MDYFSVNICEIQYIHMLNPMPLSCLAWRWRRSGSGWGSGTSPRSPSPTPTWSKRLLKRYYSTVQSISGASFGVLAAVYQYIFARLCLWRSYLVYRPAYTMHTLVTLSFVVRLCTFQPSYVHCKKRLAIFPSSVYLALTWSNICMSSVYLPWLHTCSLPCYIPCCLYWLITWIYSCMATYLTAYQQPTGRLNWLPPWIPACKANYLIAFPKPTWVLSWLST